MTKVEAIEAMKKGSKVTHYSFSDEEWITMKGNFTIVTEEGYSIPSDVFWSYRTSHGWDTDWSIYNGKN